MKLNPHIESALQTQDTDSLKALLMWFNADQQSDGTTTTRLSAILDDIQTLDVSDCYRLLHRLSTTDMVRFTLLNEFGPSFANKACFGLLTRCIRQQLSQQGMNTQ